MKNLVKEMSNSIRSRRQGNFFLFLMNFRTWNF